MRPIFSAIAMSCLPVAVLAAPACLSGSTAILACTFSNGAKTLVACHDGLVATYAYGKTGKAPDLALSAPVASLTYVPWPGIGSASWDEVGFSNEGFDYILWQNLDHRADEASALTAGIIVQQNGEELARLECDSGSITPAIEQLWDMFEAAGQCYDRANSTWSPCQ